MGAFHAYDIRGVFGVDFDGATAYKVGFFLPELLSADKILVGRDCRLSSDEIHDRLVEGITDAGADVCDLGLSTTPMVYFGTADYGFKASVQITASHNPAQYNGMKVSRENALPVGLDNGLGQIQEWIESGRECRPAAVKGTVHRMDIHQEYLSVVLKEIDSINKVIQQLLEFSRPRHSQWQQVSLNALVEETLVLVQTAGVQARVDFISELDNELSPINADRELLKQVLLNILINAVQAISARGKIRIQTWQYSDSQQAISIEDNGCGIDLSLQKKIFDPFFTTKASGTGLGLALSQRIINAHQGDIRVASLPGYGATFTLILPINPQGNQTV